MKHMEKFIATANRLHQLTKTEYHHDPINQARNIAKAWKHRGESIVFKPRSVDYQNVKVDPDDLEAAKMVTEGFQMQFEDIGLKRQHERLMEIAAEIEGLRAILPTLAGHAAVELGQLARSIVHEATSGSAGE